MFRMVSLSVLLTAAVTLTAPASAQNRLDAASMSCAALTARLEAVGSAIITNRDGSYERLVSRAGLCFRNEVTQAYPVRTQDQAACIAGYQCKPIEGDNQ